jgi:DNA-binding transcriptional regulator YdaS (Cro superfamily)
MTLQEWFATQRYGSKAKMAKELGVTKTWMCQLVAGRGRASPRVAVEIERLTEGQVSRSTLRPDLFGE